MRVIKYLGLAALTALLACQSGQHAADTKDTTSVNTVDTAKVSALAFKDDKLPPIYAAYIKLKDELVATKFDEAKLAANKLSEALVGIEGCENVVNIAKQIAGAKDIKTQRKQFTGLNTELIPIFKHGVLTSGTIYIQHCPMANNGDGGDWLSSEKKIQNPYYGSEMMECGSVVEEIKTK